MNLHISLLYAVDHMVCPLDSSNLYVYCISLSPHHAVPAVISLNRTLCRSFEWIISVLGLLHRFILEWNIKY